MLSRTASVGVGNCGGNYFTTVRQFLQAERRLYASDLRQIVKMGFEYHDLKILMTDVKNIFSDATFLQRTKMKSPSRSTTFRQLSLFGVHSHLIQVVSSM